MYAVTWLWRDSSEGESNLTKLATAAKIHRVLSSLSPMKKSKTCSYFDGTVTDGKVSMRVFGLDSSVRRKLMEFEVTTNPVAISNCEVKHSRMGKQLANSASPPNWRWQQDSWSPQTPPASYLLRLFYLRAFGHECLQKTLVTKCSEVEKLEVFDVESKCEKAAGKVITLRKLSKIVHFQRVSAEVNTLRVEEAEEASGGKKKHPRGRQQWDSQVNGVGRHDREDG